MSGYTDKPLAEIDATLDGYGWEGGFRIQEDAAHSISSTTLTPPYFFNYLPFVFVVDTSTMRIVAADSGDAVSPISIDVLAVVQAIDEGG
jgi:hypothetical protein